MTPSDGWQCLAELDADRHQRVRDCLERTCRVLHPYKPEKWVGVGCGCGGRMVFMPVVHPDKPWPN